MKNALPQQIFTKTQLESGVLKSVVDEIENVAGFLLANGALDDDDTKRVVLVTGECFATVKEKYCLLTSERGMTISTRRSL